MKSNSTKVVRIGSPDSPRHFTLAEAKDTLILVHQITADAYRELESVKTQLNSVLSIDSRVIVAEKQYEKIVNRWISKMERLGLVVKGLWLVDFDTGDGYLCWKYPEASIDFYHSYTGGFTARQPLSKVIAETSPDWAS